MDLNALQPLLDAVRGARVACVGDLMVDRYVYGEVSRISPEAPIPVLTRRSEQVMLGAVGNVARNVASLGGTAALAAVVGDDPAAGEALALAGAEVGIEADLVMQAGRATAVKTRFVAAAQQLLRLDVEDAGPVDAAAEAHMVSAAAHAAESAGVVLLSDYAKGVVTDRVAAACLKAAAKAGAPLVVDPKGRNFARYGEADLIKPNALELSVFTDLPTRGDAEVEAALAAALKACSARAVLVTRGDQGMSLAERGRPVRHFRTTPREVFDVSGAGDTGLAALGAALAAGADLHAAVEFAVLASGVAVGKAGTAAVSPEELLDAAFSAKAAPAEAKLSTLERAARTAERWRAEGLRVGFTNGCFDILHRGHVAYLTQARSWCDRLIVGLNTDASVRALKGEGRPVNDLESRAFVLGGLACVDLVAPFSESTPMKLIEAVRPDILIKGADYAADQVVGGEFVRSYGGEVRLADLVDGQSTTSIIARTGGRP